MSGPPSNGNGLVSTLNAREFRWPDFTTSWAGPDFWNEGFCFGSNDGRARTLTTDNETTGLFQAVDSGEAINGVAFFNNFIAVSTRSEVILLDVPIQPSEQPPRRISYYGGAHGVTFSASGMLVAPLGIDGLLHYDDLSRETVRRRRSQASGKTLYYYHAVSLGTSPKGDIITCAARKDGLATTTLGRDGNPAFVSTRTFPGLDVVDVCPIPSARNPHAVLAVSRDRSLHLIRDILSEEYPTISLSYPGMQGRAYRVAYGQGHVFLLTSEWVYALPNLAADFVGDRLLDVPIMAQILNICAVDLAVAHDSLLIVMPESVIKINIVEFLTRTRAENVTPDVAYPIWENAQSQALSFDAALL